MEENNKSPNNKEFNMTKIIQNIDKVKEIKAKRTAKQGVSYKPLKFEEKSDDSPLKIEIIRRINEKNLTYTNLYDYCTNIENGDQVAGRTLGYNIISGLRRGKTMMDTTFSLLCDFLGLDIMLVERNKVEEDDEDGDEDDN